MSRFLSFHIDASIEIQESAVWYDQQRPGLGEEFLATLEVQIEDLLHDPSRGSRLPGAPRSSPVRRILLRRFPYGVLFVVKESEIRVIAVMHGKRKPGYWMARLEDETG
jgi:plasmid stabilization system protein ParE